MIPRQAAEAAAAWWRDVLLKQPMKMTLGPNDDPRSDDNAAAAFGELMATAYAPRFTPDQGDAFAREFVALLLDPDARAVDRREWNDSVIVACDYGPDPALAEATRRAGFDTAGTLAWPWKTVMHIYQERVDVAHGYGRPFETIWAMVAT
jgi:hypothetical protein